MASPTGDNDAGSSGQEISFKLQSRDLPSRRLLGKGLSGIGYETLWKGERFARKDFIGVPRGIFEKEAAILVGLEDHKNIVKTYGWTVDKRSCSLVLEYMDDDLLSLMEKRTEIKQDLADIGSGSQSSTSTVKQPFDLPQALDIMLQIAAGMKALHEQGIAHGHLKTKNILVTYVNDRDQNLMAVKVTDFGLVCSKRKSKYIVSRQVRKLHMVQWKAPEYLKAQFGKPNLSYDKDGTSSESDSNSESELESEATSTPPVVNVRLPGVDVFAADVYSFAVTCSHILTGKDPYPNLNWKELVIEILSGLRPNLPAACQPLLRDILKSCWGDPPQRPTFSAICMRLKHLRGALLITDSSVEIVERMISIVPSIEPVRITPISQVFQVDCELNNPNLASESPAPSSRVGRKSRFDSFMSEFPSSGLIPSSRRDRKSICGSPEYNRAPPRHRDALKKDPAVEDPAVKDPAAKKINYRGVSYRGELKKYVAEIRPAKSMKKIWLGTYGTAEEAALAFDIGNLCCKRNLPLNFPDSPSMLREIPSDLSQHEARKAIAKLAKEVVRVVYAETPSTGETDTRGNVDGAAAIEALGRTQQEAAEQEPVPEPYTELTLGKSVPPTSIGIEAFTFDDRKLVDP